LDESRADPAVAKQLLGSRNANLHEPDWGYDKNYHERQQKALEEAGLK